MKISFKILFCFYFLLFSFQEIFAQDCCDNDQRLIVCYVPSDEFCSNDCRYNYDASFMEGLRQKLNNPANFGPNGVSPCEVEEIALRNITAAQQLTDLDCDIVFFGIMDGAFNALLGTNLPMEFTDAVKEWSVECPSNLTVLFQGSTTRWGYEIAAENQNPNTPGANNISNIFNGPFGSIDEVLQGGSFQANFSVTPATGTTILAQDALGRPTIVIDDATNDILMADVGLVCNGAGNVSNSTLILSNNDILVANIFALGCEIAGDFTEDLAIICENENYTLPDGMIINAEGEYSSTILSSLGCDSTILTTVEFSIPQPSTYTYDGCREDGFEIMIGNGTYNQSNPTGAEILPSFYGCDSLVNIELTFKENSESTLNTIICPEDSFQYLDYSFSTDTDTIIVIPNTVNCDSFINVIVEVFDFSDVQIDTTPINIFNQGSYTFNTSIPNSYNVLWEPSIGLSCTDCPNPILTNTDNINIYTLSITSEEGCMEDYTFNVEYICTPYIPSIFNPESTSGNDKYGPLTPCNMTDYHFVIYDRWGSIVFETNDQQALWDGRLDKKDIQPGVFVYLCEYSNKGVLAQESGHLTLVR